MASLRANIQQALEQYEAAPFWMPRDPTHWIQAIFSGFFPSEGRTSFPWVGPDAERMRSYSKLVTTSGFIPYSKLSRPAGSNTAAPGQRITDAMNAVKETIKSQGLEICEAGIHGHGLSSQEFPRYRHHAPPHADDNALEAIGHELKPGMVFCFNIDLVDPSWRNGETGCVFAETVVITEDKPRYLHSFPQNFQIINC